LEEKLRVTFEVFDKDNDRKLMENKTKDMIDQTDPNKIDSISCVITRNGEN
jgi:Ca2+-binding EF-hand superfamily protein